MKGKHEPERLAFAKAALSVGCYDWWSDENIHCAKHIALEAGVPLVMTVFPARRMKREDFTLGAAPNVRIDRLAEKFYSKFQLVDAFVINFEEVPDSNQADVVDIVDQFLKDVVAVLRRASRGCAIVFYDEGASRDTLTGITRPLLPRGKFYGDSDSFSGYPMEVGIWRDFASASTQRRESWAWLWLSHGNDFPWYYTADRHRLRRGQRIAWGKNDALRFFSHVGRLIGENPRIPGAMIHQPAMWSIDFQARFAVLVGGINEGVAIAGEGVVPRLPD